MKAICLLALVPAIAAAEVQTVLHPDVVCAPGKTIVWTAAMQSAFDRMVGPKSPLKFERADPANKLVTDMLAFPWKEEAVLPKDGWFAIAGPAKDKLAAEATVKWRAMAGQDQPAFEIAIDPRAEQPGLAAFVGMRRDFEFSKAFEPSREVRLEWGADKQPVKFFGTRGSTSAAYADAVKVLAYRPKEGVQALQIDGKAGDDTLILYAPKEAQSMLEAMRWVRTWRKDSKPAEESRKDWNDKQLHYRDDLRIPEISLEKNEELKGLIPGFIRFKGESRPWIVSQLRTQMKLAVDARGVKFQASAAMQTDPFASGVEEVPRKFWFDRPFFLFLWRDGAELPYAGVWFGDASGLVK